MSGIQLSAPKIEGYCDNTGADLRAKLRVELTGGEGVAPVNALELDVREKRGRLDGTFSYTENGVANKFNINDMRVPESMRAKARHSLKACHATAEHLHERLGASSENQLPPSNAPRGLMPKF